MESRTNLVNVHGGKWMASPIHVCESIYPTSSYVHVALSIGLLALASFSLSTAAFVVLYFCCRWYRSFPMRFVFRKDRFARYPLRHVHVRCDEVHICFMITIRVGQSLLAKGTIRWQMDVVSGNNKIAVVGRTQHRRGE